MFYSSRVFKSKEDAQAYLQDRGFAPCLAPWADGAPTVDGWIRYVGAVTSRATIGQCKTGEYLISVA